MKYYLSNIDKISVKHNKCFANKMAITFKISQVFLFSAWVKWERVFYVFSYVRGKASKCPGNKTIA